jgi:hypothetical protein
VECSFIISGEDIVSELPLAARLSTSGRTGKRRIIAIKIMEKIE